MPQRVSPPTSEQIKSVRKRILKWYGQNKRNLLWRDQNDPYIVLMSEIMLQQTQVARVQEKLPLWLKRFPTIASLAKASKKTVLIAWSGMGYNRRALNLHKAAQIIMQEHNGIIPNIVIELKNLPGFGAYTASAVACFGYNKRVPLVDINIRRFFSRVFIRQHSENDMIPDSEAWKLAEMLLPPRAYYNWNQALMDFGAMVCTATNPKCAVCPIKDECKSYDKLKPAIRQKGAIKEVPRRIYRGKVIEYLRNVNDTYTATFHSIGTHLVKKFSDNNHAWLLDILQTLQNDEMIDVLKSTRHIEIATYAGDANELIVRLTEE